MKLQFLRAIVIGIVLLGVFNSGVIFASQESETKVMIKQIAFDTHSGQVSTGSEIDPTFIVFLPFIQSWISVPEGMVHIPAGEFLMGCSNDNPTGYCEEDEQPVHPVYLDAYFMDIYEVTNAKYSRCVAEGPCTNPQKTYSNTRDPYYNNPTYANYPVI
jgi:formylglycine-generating enzyme required for sulfatase activity